jgi:hypothetical protein
LNTSTVAATANTPSLNASARDFFTATTIRCAGQFPG